MAAHDNLPRRVAHAVKWRLDRLQSPHPGAEPVRSVSQRLQCLGFDVRTDASTTVEYAEGLALGNHVRIGADVQIVAPGGVMICDGVQIGQGAMINSAVPLPNAGRNPDAPDEHAWGEVFIGANATIGEHACIMPGTTIGANAHIAPGATVLKDVPANTTFGYFQHDLDTEQRRTTVNLDENNSLALPSNAQAPLPTGRQKRPRMCFIVSTGRAGSTSIPQIFNNHPDLSAKHEPRYQLIKLSTEYAHGMISPDEARAALERLFLDGSVYDPSRIHLESDLKYFNLIPLLLDIFPDAKFIWLVRSAEDVVASTYSRSWFSDRTHPIWKKIDWHYHQYRVQGDRCGDISPEDWAAMDPFARNCWYWSYINRTIQADINTVPASNRMLVRLEELGSHISDILDFLDVDLVSLPIEHANKAFYSKIDPKDWDSAQYETYKHLCGPLMRELYNR